MSLPGKLRMLKRAGYTPITFRQMADARAGTSSLPPKPVLLTFDDGYTNLKTNVHPLLGEMGLPLHGVFWCRSVSAKLTTGSPRKGYTPTPLLSWADIAEMQREPSRLVLKRTRQPTLSCPSSVLPTPRREMSASKDALRAAPANPQFPCCATPTAMPAAASRDIAAEIGYTQAVTTEFGRTRLSDPPLLLPRISVYHVPPLSLTYGVGSWNFRWRLESRKDTRPLTPTWVQHLHETLVQDTPLAGFDPRFHCRRRSAAASAARDRRRADCPAA